MNYDHWKSSEPDPNEWELQQETERCPFCNADPDDSCQDDCMCSHCQAERLRVLDVDPEGEVA